MANYESEVRRLQAEGRRDAVYQALIADGMDPEAAAHYAAGGTEWNDPRLSPEREHNARVRDNMRADRDRSIAHGERLNANVDHIMAGGGPRVEDPELLEMMERKRRRDRETTMGSPESLALLREKADKGIAAHRSDQYTDEQGRPLTDRDQDGKVVYKYSSTGRITRKDLRGDDVEDKHQARAMVNDPTSDYHGGSFNPHTYRYDRRRKRIVKRDDVDHILREGGASEDLLGDGTLEETRESVQARRDEREATRAERARVAEMEANAEAQRIAEEAEAKRIARAENASAKAARAAAAQGQIGAHDAALGEEAAIRDYMAGVEGDRGQITQGMLGDVEEWSAEKAENRTRPITDPDYSEVGSFEDWQADRAQAADDMWWDENALTPGEIEGMSQDPAWPVDLEGRGPSGVPDAPVMQDPSFPEMPMQNIPGPGSPDLPGELPGASGLERSPSQSPQAMINSMDDDQISRLRQMIPDPAMAALVIGQLMGGGANINQMNPQGSPMPPVQVPANPGSLGASTHVPMGDFFSNLPMDRRTMAALNNQIPLNTQLQMRQGMAPVPGLGGAPFPAPVSPLQSGNEQAIRNLLQQIK